MPKKPADEPETVEVEEAPAITDAEAHAEDVRLRAENPNLVISREVGTPGAGRI